jgi:predicted phage terminase large subunit-like protein
MTIRSAVPLNTGGLERTSRLLGDLKKTSRFSRTFGGSTTSTRSVEPTLGSSPRSTREPPRPKEAALFQEPTFYTELPKNYRTGYGIDLAYTESTRADFSVVIKGFYSDGRLYIVDLIRSQCHAPAFAEILTREFNAQPAPMIWIASGTEKGAAQFIRQKVPKLRIKVASSDKYTRATPVAEAWNAGRVLVPALEQFSKATWVSEFIREVTRFSGHHDVNDDQVDALAALWRVFQASPMVAAMKSLSAQGI